MWDEYLHGYTTFLTLEKSFSKHSIQAYSHDVQKFIQFLEIEQIQKKPADITIEHLQHFMRFLVDIGLSANSQARIIAGIRQFYTYCLMEEIVVEDITSLLSVPTIHRKLPDVLSVDEVNHIVSVIDLSKSEGTRNKAMIEVLYSCGLRVSELISLQLSHILWADECIRVRGKGNKERVIPISTTALHYLSIYINDIRNKMFVQKDAVDVIFLNKRGQPLSRVMVFYIIKDLAKKANVQKKISPHSFRHAFATHLVEGGADLRAIQSMLGHQSITTTEIYAHLSKEYLRDTLHLYHPAFSYTKK